MINKLYWFDIDFDQVHPRNHAWLETVLKTVAERFDCEPLRAIWPQSINEARSWLDVFRLHPPTPDSILLLHGRTPGVEQIFDALWTAADRQPERLPRCRIVYSGGSEWDSLAHRRFLNSKERLCRIKANSFKWGDDQNGSVSDASGYLIRTVGEYVSESKSPEVRLNDTLRLLAEEIFEAALNVTASILTSDATDEACGNVADSCLIVQEESSTLIKEWPAGSDERERLVKIKASAEKLIEYLDNAADFKYEEVFQNLFRDSSGASSLYDLIIEAPGLQRNMT